MPTEDQMTRAVHAYVDAFAASDADQARDLFAPDATVEDPVGSPPHVGHAAIHAFYAASMQTGAKLTLDGPVRIAGNTAAFAFSVVFADPGMGVDVIDLFEFAEDGKVKAMKAYFGPSNMRGFEGFTHA